MGKHTPGPWYREGKRIRGDYGFVIEASGELIISNADARLIAAAPSMLEALKLVSEFGCDCHDEPERSPCMVCVANEAIAKAEGKN